MREQIKKELNNIAWVFESQSMNASKVVECPLLHNNGSFLFKYFHITSDEKLFELEEYFNYYTKRFEETINPGLLINELSAILKKCTLIKKYYIENLTENTKIVNEYYNNIPVIFEEKIKYNKSHTAIFVAENRVIQDIIFGVDFESNEASWTHQKYNNITTNSELLTFLDKLINFIGNFDINEFSKQTKKVSFAESRFEDLFKNSECYKQAIDTLVENKYIRENGLNLDWIGSKQEVSLAPKKLLCVLAIVLDSKNYLLTDTSQTKKSIALTNTFKVKISNIYYGRITKSIDERNAIPTSKINEYYYAFHFLKTL